MLKVHTKNLGSVAILCVQGRIVNGETATLRNAVDSQSEVSAVVLDLARVSTVDAHGLGVMLELRERALSKGIDFKLMNVTKLVSRVMEITRLDSVFQVTSGAEVLSSITRGRPDSMELVTCA
ncbi:MAG TPA: STAS domain-containing protein [Pyrinomonadaceae bacterium]|nr:STAS domain-containing protein [Pyrinomonadaceae bacterium]